MKKLIEKIQKIRDSEVEKTINKRIKYFKSLNKKNNKEWFSELCFCILTANSKAETALNIQNEIGSEGFLDFSKEKLAKIIKRNKHRFHNNKAEFIIKARRFSDIKEIVKKQKDAFESREFIVKNIKGLGYKESSHFLRNVGYFELAILDRHIIRVLMKNNIISKIPECITPKCYLDFENKFFNLSKKVALKPGILDLYLWYMETGTVLK
ncbi:N-glycosylase/DNA lyase [Candidatus Woesearchaeota archaeon]|nr:N-glycosylase/DNA lyase [Candidatus Woesearchaeota archaeon]